MRFRLLVAAPTAIAVLLHAILGCCAHHAHAVEGPCHEPTAHCAEHLNGDSCHADHESECLETPADHKDHDDSGDCDEARCAFAVVGKVILLKSSFAAAAFLASLPDAALAIGGLSRWQAFAWMPDGIAPQLRPHLLLQVMLI